MRKLIVGVLLSITATVVYANCTTSTISMNGKMVICTTCCTNGMCNTFCN